jgi:hypothetical protein
MFKMQFKNETSLWDHIVFKNQDYFGSGENPHNIFLNALWGYGGNASAPAAVAPPLKR